LRSFRAKDAAASFTRAAVTLAPAQRFAGSACSGNSTGYGRKWTMVRRKIPKTRLPRLTLLAFDKRLLAAFLEAVESLTHTAKDLQELTAELRVKSSRKQRSATNTDATM
jgi:hypothetical protein